MTTVVLFAAALSVSSPAFQQNGSIPPEFTCDGAGKNPALEIGGLPAGAKSLALIMDDPDAPMGTFVHWVVYNLSPQTKEIAENSKPQGDEGQNGAGKTGYIGPCPPSGTHHYHFKLYALDTMLDFPQIPDKKAVEDKMRNHIIDKAELVGLFSK